MRCLKLREGLLAALFLVACVGTFIRPSAPLWWHPSDTQAQTVCAALPYTFVNGTIADAGQVNANFTAVVACIQQVRSAPYVADLNALQTSSTVSYAQGVWRYSYVTGSSAPPLFYIPGTTACSLNSGNGDNGAQVKSSDGKCWNAIIPTSGADARQWGWLSAGDGTAAAQAASDAMYNLHLPTATLLLPTAGNITELAIYPNMKLKCGSGSTSSQAGAVPNPYQITRTAVGRGIYNTDAPGHAYPQALASGLDIEDCDVVPITAGMAGSNITLSAVFNWKVYNTSSTNSGTATESTGSVGATATGTGDGANLSNIALTSIAGTIHPGSLLNAAMSGTGIPSGTFVSSFSGGTTYVANQTISGSFTGVISNGSGGAGTQLAVSAITGTIVIGQTVQGAGVTAGTKIVSGSGSSWVVDTSQNIGSEAMTSIPKSVAVTILSNLLDISATNQGTIAATQMLLCAGCVIANNTYTTINSGSSTPYTLNDQIPQVTGSVAMVTSNHWTITDSLGTHVIPSANVSIIGMSGGGSVDDGLWQGGFIGGTYGTNFQDCLTPGSYAGIGVYSDALTTTGTGVKPNHNRFIGAGGVCNVVGYLIANGADWTIDNLEGQYDLIVAMVGIGAGNAFNDTFNWPYLEGLGINQTRVAFIVGQYATSLKIVGTGSMSYVINSLEDHSYNTVFELDNYQTYRGNAEITTYYSNPTIAGGSPTPPGAAFIPRVNAGKAWVGNNAQSVEVGPFVYGVGSIPSLSCGFASGTVGSPGTPVNGTTLCRHGGYGQRSASIYDLASDNASIDVRAAAGYGVGNYNSYLVARVVRGSSTTGTDEFMWDTDGSYHGVALTAHGDQYIGAKAFYVPQTTWTASPTCTAGDIVWDASFVYVCTALNAAGRIPINAFTQGTLVIANGKTFTVNNTITLSGTDGTTMTLPTTSKTLMASDYSNATAGGALTGGQPSNPTGTTAAIGSQKMMGLGSVCQITPVVTGRVAFRITGTVTNNTATDGGQIYFRYGTGTPPTNGAADTGTTTLSQPLPVSGIGTMTIPFVQAGTAQMLTKTTLYWFDLALAIIAGGTASVANITCDAFEVL